MCELCRRSFIGGLGALGAAAAFPTPLLAQARTPEAQVVAEARDTVEAIRKRANWR
jgi:hypothetical protein